MAEQNQTIGFRPNEEDADSIEGITVLLQERWNAAGVLRSVGVSDVVRYSLKVAHETLLAQDLAGKRRDAE